MKRLLFAVALILFVGLGLSNVTQHKNQLKLKEIELKDTSLELKQLEQKYDVELKQKDVNQDKINELQKEKDNLTQQLQAKADEKARLASIAVTAKVYAEPAPKPQASIAAGCGDNSMANYIYMHESGCNLNAVNAGGCRGIGQACPGSKLPCGADYACQNAFFTKYANERYGGWAGAYQFWLNNHWW